MVAEISKKPAPSFPIVGMGASAGGLEAFVLPADKMPQALMSRISHQPAVPAEVVTSDISRILMQLRSATGHDFSQYKKSTITRRIARRMSMHDIDSLEVYARYLKEHPGEITRLFKELLINVTNFFRDPDAFATLKEEILPQLFESKPEDYVFRVWVAGCASGEEAYSIAILFCEYMEQIRCECRIQLFATDLDDDAIAVARAGYYPLNIAQDISEERLRRYFIREDEGYRVRKHIREMVVFAIQNVIKDPPFTRLDLLSCRNLMIYLEPEVQSKLIPAFHYALKPGGILFLSPSESIGNYPELFSPVSRKWKFYRASGTLDDVINGVVLTFTDISSRVAAEDAVRKARDLAEGIVNTVCEPLIVLDEQLQVVTASRSFYRYFATRQQDTEGCLIYRLGNNQWDIPSLRHLLEGVLSENQFFDGFSVEHDFPGIGGKKLLLNARRISDDASHQQLILLAMEEL